jgi:hypothetical protein
MIGAAGNRSRARIGQINGLDKREINDLTAELHGKLERRCLVCYLSGLNFHCRAFIHVAAWIILQYLT